MWRSSESSDPRKKSLHRRVSLLRRSEVGNASASGSFLDDDTDANWNDMEPEWWERLDRGPDKRASANYLPVNRSNTPNYSEILVQERYGLKSLLRTEKFIKNLAGVVNIVLKSKGGHHHYVDTLKREMARLQLVTTYFDFCCFIHEYLPFYFRIKSIAAEGRDVPEFTGKVFQPILNGNKKKRRH